MDALSVSWATSARPTRQRHSHSWSVTRSTSLCRAISLEHIDNIPGIVNNEKVVGLLLEIKDGDRTIGYLYTIFSEKSAANIVDTLLGQPQGTTTVIGEMEQSAIMEVGNILASSFCDAIAEFLGLVLLPSPPNYVNDMVSAIIQSSLIEISMVADDAILFRTDLSDDQQHLRRVRHPVPEPGDAGPHAGHPRR